MRRKRRNRPTWFPILGTTNGESQASTVYTNNYTILAGSNSFAPLTSTFTELLDDADTGESDANASLRDRVEGKDYALTRIVGKVWGAFQQHLPEAEPTEAVPVYIVFCLAMGILPVDAAGLPEGTDTDYNPLLSANSAKPWMWRRTWTLWNNIAVPADNPIGGAPFYTGPTGIQNVGSGMLDAGHVDCKSRRRVRKEERLFLLTSAYVGSIADGAGNSPDTTNTDMQVEWGYDLRVLGGMRRAHNKSVLT